MPKYRVAYIFTPISFGGAERVNLTFLKNVDRERFSVQPLVLIRPWERENQVINALQKEKYDVSRVPVAKRHRSEGPDRLRLLRCFRMIHAFLKKGPFDIVHTHGYFADIMAAPASKMLGIPHIATCHGFISTDFNLSIYNRLDRAALRMAKRIIAVSDGIRRDLIRSGIPESRVVTIKNAVNGLSDAASRTAARHEKRALIKAAGQELIIGYAGRLSEEKNVSCLIKACSFLRENSLPVRALILGDGPQRRELEDLVREKKLGRKVFFAGFQEEVERWLPALDVFVLPSLAEGTPMALLEAMACGIPAVATAVGGVPDVIDPGRTGLLVPPDSPEAVAEAVSRLYFDRSFRDSMAQAARNDVLANYGVQDWTRKIESEYVCVMGQGR
jgi:glycosyltransferase involved in cell wall biosynthesis